MDAGLTITERLYFDDPYLRTFTARVIERMQRAGLPAVALDRSAFYPEGGGQPGDRGTLNGIPVLDTQEDGDLVWHILTVIASWHSNTGGQRERHGLSVQTQHLSVHASAQCPSPPLGC